MATAIPPGAQPHLAALTQRLQGFEDDHAQGFGLLVLATDMRDVADAATRAADALRDAHMRGTKREEVET